MTWFKVEDSFAFHRKAMEAGNAALGLWVRAGSYCAQQLTDGYVPMAMVRKLGTMSQARRLVSAGLWRETSGGFVFHEFTNDNRNPTSNAIRAQRERANGRQAKHRDTQKNTESQVKESSHGVSHTGTDTRDSHESPPEPDTRGSHVTPYGPARRPDQTRPSIPNGIEIPPSAGDERPNEEPVPSINAGRIVSRWSEVYETQIGRKPSGGMRGQVGREAKQWLGTHDPELVLKAAEQAARKGYPTLSREIAPMVAQQREPAMRRDPGTGICTDDLPW